MPPFFSIVIPTKNRPEFLRDSIYSALNQNFQDIEVIVSDNFNDEETKKVVDEFLPNPKLKYYRTEKEMNMLDHWESATKKANGEWVVLLPDRKVLVQGATRTIYKWINKYSDINALSFRISSYNENVNRFMWEPEKSKTMILSSKELLDNFINTNYYSSQSIDFKLPKTLNGAFRNAFARDIRQKFGNYFNTPGVATPDYSSFFTNALLSKYSLYIDERLGIAQNEQNSNGRLFGKGQTQAYIKSLGLEQEELYDNLVPFKQPFIYNLLILDYLKISKKFNHFPILNWENYFRTIFSELENKLQADILPQELKKEYENSLYKAIEEKGFLKEDICRSINEVPCNRFKLVANIKNHLQDYILHNHPNNKMLCWMFVLQFKSVLEAAGFKSQRI